MNKSILILGGTGAMGAFLVELFTEYENYNVYVTSRKERKDYKNISYINGNARDVNFINEICNRKYDCIIDFMNYNLEEFEVIHDKLLSACNHYLFLSSCRVFDNSDLITENTNRLLDVTDDLSFKKTNRYALRKAREENILKNNKYDNWTIIRPYITYSNRRLQLGIYEKEEWLYRLLNNKDLIIRREILDKFTSLAYGLDVAKCIKNIALSGTLKSDSINLVTEQTIKWSEILSLYKKILKEKLNINPKVFVSDNLENIEILYEGGYNTKYDRLWNRKFDNTKLKNTCDIKNFIDVYEGLRLCLSQFIDDWKIYGNSIFGHINEEYENTMDQLLKDKKNLKEFGDLYD